MERYAEDQDLFFADFATVFAKLMKLGIRRDAEGKITNTDNEKGGYLSAPKKIQRLCQLVGFRQVRKVEL